MTTIHITDHAVLRYIEHIQGVDIEALRMQLHGMATRAAQAAETIGGGNYIIKAEGVRLRVVGRNVVTVLPPKERG